MVKRCCYGVCNTDSRYEDRLAGGVYFIPFPKKKTNIEKCLKWIRACGRPHSQLNADRIKKTTYICSKHFVGGKGPTEEYPDPVSHDDKTPKPARKLPRRTLESTPVPRVQDTSTQPTKRTRLEFQSPDSNHCRDVLSELPVTPNTPLPEVPETPIDPPIQTQKSSASQTESHWVDPQDLLGLAVEKRLLERELGSKILENEELRREQSASKNKKNPKQPNSKRFSINNFIGDDKMLKYYTGFSNLEFNVIYAFLVPNEEEDPLHLPKTLGRKLSLKDQLFLTLCKLRNNFDFKDLGYRFNLSAQDCSQLFCEWINFMFLRFGELDYWPSRNILEVHMPANYKRDFPNTFAILDCTEVKIQKPSSLNVQSQTYSDYKSTNTMKALVAVDPRGSLLFTSCLFSGSISDKEIFDKCGLKTMLSDFVSNGKLRAGDGLMADKGFNIEKDIKECGLKLNIPPFARSRAQMSQTDVLLTKKIAAHRVHVERAIGHIKKFKILSGKIPLSLFGRVNQIWFVCCFLILFQKPIIKSN